MTENVARDRLAAALFDEMGWASPLRYHPERAKQPGDYSTFDPVPEGIVSGDADHDDWRAFADRLLAAGVLPPGDMLAKVRAIPALRLTGEQLDSIDPTPPSAASFSIDFDEYDDFVPLTMLEAVLEAAETPGEPQS
jgi:hypothetical protein